MNKEDLLLEQWKMASELHRHMDRMAWQRSNYFVVVNGILLSVLGAVWKDVSKTTLTLTGVSAAISFFGVITSLVWALVQKRGQWYHRYRVAQADEAERALKVNGERVLTLYEEGIDEQELVPISGFRKYSTYGLICWLALALVIAWLILLACFLFLCLKKVG